MLLVSLCYLFVYRDLSKLLILNFVHLVIIASGWNIRQWFLFWEKKKGKGKSKGKKRNGIKVEIFLTMSTLSFLAVSISPPENEIWYGVYKKDALKSLHKLAVYLFIHISPWLITYHHEAPQATHKKKSRHKSN